MQDTASLGVNSGPGGLRRLAGSALLSPVALLLSLVALCAAAPAGTQQERNIERYATRRVQPGYPPNAHKYRVEGEVTVQVTVGDNGAVARAEFIRGQDVFRSVALDAAKRWTFKLPEGSRQGAIRFTFKLER